MEKKSEREHVQHFLHTCIKCFWKFHVVVAQNNSKEMYKKVCCSCKVAFLLIRPIVVVVVVVVCLLVGFFLLFSLPPPLSVIQFYVLFGQTIKIIERFAFSPG